MSFQYDLELGKIEDFIQKKPYNKILIQMPEGMLDLPLKLVTEKLTSLGKDFVLSGDPSYGICDIAIDLANRLECDLLIHFGHTEFGFSNLLKKNKGKNLDILLVPSFMTSDISPFLESLKKRLSSLGWVNIGLVATAQHLGILQKVKEYLISKGFRSSIIGDGQIIGCHVGSLGDKTKDIDGIVSLHAGNFHTKGILLSTKIPILQLNPYSGEILFHGTKEREKIIQIRYSIIHQAQKARAWGILGSTKIGQYHPFQIEKAEKILARHNKSRITIIAENLNHKSLTNLNWVEAWIDTACPRLIEDQINFSKPILNFKEFLVLFDEITWNNLLENGFF